MSADKKLLVFCTCCNVDFSRYYVRAAEWGRQRLALDISAKLMVFNDGPDRDFRELWDLNVTVGSNEPVMGRKSVPNFPGWKRSFGKAMLYSLSFDYCTHIESDVRIVDRAVLDRYLYRKGSYAAFDHRYRRIESAVMFLNDRVVRGQLAHKFLSYEIMHSNVEAEHEMFPHVSVASDIHSYRQEGKPIPEYLKPKLAFIT